MLRDSLLKLFQSAAVNSTFDNSILIADDLIEQGIDMPVELENALIDFLVNKDSNSFVALSKEALYRSLLDGVETIKLLSYLAKREWLPLADVALFLTAISYTERDKLLPVYGNAVMMAGLVLEDLSDGIMGVDDDALLLNALKSI